jgi:hypothetical protein
MILVRNMLHFKADLVIYVNENNFKSTHAPVSGII